MRSKALNDAAAYLRSLAQLRGRNADWAERAVRESLSISADEALRLRVIELVAPNVASLLEQLDGRTVAVLGQDRPLATRGAHVVEFVTDWRTDALAALTTPCVALLLMTIGIYGLVFEFMNPGAVAPGVIGGICLLPGLYALQLLPVNYAGLALIALGLVFMDMEAFLPSFGILGLGGIAAFVAGALMLVDTELPGYGIPLGLPVPLAVASALLLSATARLALRTRQQRRAAPGTDGAGGRAQRPDPGRGARERKGQPMIPGFGLGFGALFFLLLALLVSAIRILREYERGVVFQLGRFWGVKGPGLVIVIPVLQQMVRVDLRTIVLDVPTQDVISRDNVSVKVNAVIYFRVVDPERAIIQVANFLEATSQLAQTTLRAVLGKHELDEMLAERERLNLDIQQVLDAQTDAWGIQVANVEIKHVDLDESMIRAIARQAEAERERRAKVIHAEGELQASEKLQQAAFVLAQQPGAMQLRTLQTLGSIAGDKSSTIVFPLPMDVLAGLTLAPRKDGS